MKPALKPAGGSPAPLAAAPLLEVALPPLIAGAGPRARTRFVEFFTAQIRNANTRQAYARAILRFCTWAQRRGLRLRQLKPIVVAVYIEELGREIAAPSVKLHLAAIRMLCDWFVLGQVLPWNPAASVRGPKHVVREGQTPILTPVEARRLLDSIGEATPAARRDRALIGVMLFAFVRVSATVGVRVRDYRAEKRMLRLQEKGGKAREVPVHGELAGMITRHVAAAGLKAESPLFPALAGRTGRFKERAMSRGDALRMIKRRASAAGIAGEIGCHSFRGTGITAYLAAGGTIERAQWMAGHESPQTTKLYDRHRDVITPEELERMAI